MGIPVVHPAAVLYVVAHHCNYCNSRSLQNRDSLGLIDQQSHRFEGANSLLMDRYFVGVDVGSGSARAGIFDCRGLLIGGETCSHPIKQWNPRENYYEQSSDDIWNAVCQCMQDALRVSGVDPRQIDGIGFDATCSLVVLGTDDKPLAVNLEGEAERNVIMWMDHRASSQAERITGTGHKVLRHIGGTMSPEMEMPKLLWLKENLPQTFAKAANFMDLGDYLTYRATKSTTRSNCTTTCKWAYVGGEWSADFLQIIGLQQFVAEGFARIGTEVAMLGMHVGDGLTSEAAEQLGLCAHTAVSTAIIDAHAGGVGMIGMYEAVSTTSSSTMSNSNNIIGAAIDSPSPLSSITRPTSKIDFRERLALIGGTSTCHMTVSSDPIFVKGVWGPYCGAMVPGLWLNEGGQSVTGALIDHVIQTHICFPQLQKLAKQQGITEYEVLNRRVAEQFDSKRNNTITGTGAASTAVAGVLLFPAELTNGLHVCPFHHGNRSPLADVSLRGMVSGLGLSATIDDLALMYLATIQALAYGTRHIIEELNKCGYNITTIMACGGDTKNRLFVQEHCDITGCRIVLPQVQEAVLLGSAMLGATAAGVFSSVTEAMASMSGARDIIEPNADPSLQAYHSRKYAVYNKLYQDQMEYAKIMCV